MGRWCIWGTKNCCNFVPPSYRRTAGSWRLTLAHICSRRRTEVSPSYPVGVCPSSPSPLPPPCPPAESRRNHQWKVQGPCNRLLCPVFWANRRVTRFGTSAEPYNSVHCSGMSVCVLYTHANFLRHFRTGVGIEARLWELCPPPGEVFQAWFSCWSLDKRHWNFYLDHIFQISLIILSHYI